MSKGDAPTDVRDRFVDDFDRSWPRSKPSPAAASQDLPAPRSPAGSVNGLHPSASPVDSSRVLFNERSNRLEPFNHSRTGGGGKEGWGREYSGTANNVQVLQKPQNDFSSRNRRFSGASNSGAPSSPRDGLFPRRDGPPPSPRMGHAMAPSSSQGGRDRRGNMGPPPVPIRALKTAQEAGRQLPPHLTQATTPRREPLPLTPASSKAPSLPSHSPVMPHSALSAMSPIIGSVVGLPLPPGTDLDEVRKDVMHNAAARAKQRREQEEAEREAQKERARKKAQELEEKMKRDAEEKARAQREKEEAEKSKEVAPAKASSVSDPRPTLYSTVQFDHPGRGQYHHPRSSERRRLHPSKSSQRRNHQVVICQTPDCTGGVLALSCWQSVASSTKTLVFWFRCLEHNSIGCGCGHQERGA